MAKTNKKNPKPNLPNALDDAYKNRTITTATEKGKTQIDICKTNGKITEVFIATQTDHASNNALAHMISTALQYGATVKEVMGQLREANAQAYQPNNSLLNAIVNALKAANKRKGQTV